MGEGSWVEGEVSGGEGHVCVGGWGGWRPTPRGVGCLRRNPPPRTGPRSAGDSEWAGGRWEGAAGGPGPTVGTLAPDRAGA